MFSYLRPFKQVLSIIFEKKLRKNAVLIFVLGLTVALIQLCTPFLIGSSVGAGAGSDPTINFSFIMLFIILNSTVPFLSTISGYYIVDAREKITKERTLTLLSGISKKSFEETSKYSEISAIIKLESTVLHTILDQVIGTLGPTLIALITAFILLSSIDSLSAFAIMAVFLTSVLIFYISNRPIVRTVKVTTQRDIKLGSLVVETVEKIDEYQAFGATPYILDKIRRQIDKKIKIAMINVCMFTRQNFLVGFVKLFGISIVALSYLHDGSITANDGIELLAFIIAFERISGPSENIVRAITRVIQELAIFEVSEKRYHFNKTHSLYLSKSTPILKITFNNPIGFAGTKKIKIKGEGELFPGESLAITGPSGLGKTTLAKAICGLTNFGYGHISYKDKTTQQHKIPPGSIIYIPQNTELISGTIVENIRFFDPTIKDECVKRVMTDLELNNIKNERSNSQISEKSRNVSGGQIKRIAIARALVRQPQGIVFDETFANLDMVSVVRILRVLKQKIPYIFIVSHNDNIVNLCNKKWNIENGEFILNINNEEIPITVVENV